VPRLDARYDWIGWNFNPSALGNATLPVVPFGDGCSANSANVSGAIALVHNTTTCDYFAQVRAAQAANASALAVVAAEGSSLVDMNCVGAECNDASVGLPATMIPYAVGQRLSAAIERGERVLMGFSTIASRGTDFLIGADGKLGQSWGGSGLGASAIDGNPGDSSAKLYPRMSFLCWAARYELYRARLEGGASRASSGAGANSADVVVPILHSAAIRPPSGNCYGSMPWGCGATAVVSVPSVGRGVKLAFDLALGCNGSRDVDCPQWDHVLQLRACKLPAGHASCDAQAGPEVGRWMTSFSRRVGHWLLDVTPLAPLLSSADEPTRFNFTIYSAPWAGNQGQIPWVVTLSLRVSHATVAQLPPSTQPVEATDAAAAKPAAVESVASPPSPVVALRPWGNVTTETGGIASIFKWVAFNQSYDTYFPPFEFALPKGASRVRLHAVITGHGNDNHGCGEFCGTEHRFVVNGGAPHVKHSLLAATNPQLGCAEEVDRGVTPNEYGTWLYGRDGWCNGSPVVPWVKDVTADALHGRNAEGTGRVKLTYTAVWCSSPTSCTPPNPGPPSTWSQAPPVMMPSVFVLID